MYYESFLWCFLVFPNHKFLLSKNFFLFKLESKVIKIFWWKSTNKTFIAPRSAELFQERREKIDDRPFIHLARAKKGVSKFERTTNFFSSLQIIIINTKWQKKILSMCEQQGKKNNSRRYDRKNFACPTVLLFRSIREK